MAQIPIHDLRHVNSKRNRIAKMLGCRVSANVKEPGLYAFSYGTFIMVRYYVTTKNGFNRAIFEEKAPREGFPTDELLTKLMLVAR